MFKIAFFPVFLIPAAFAQSQDCITLAAQCFQVNPLLIKAIIWQESGNRQNAINKNNNNTVDVGVMQVNSIHYKTLHAMGITEKDLRENSCANVFAGTWVLNQAIQHKGYTWDGVGYYHSATPTPHDIYVKKIIRIIAYKLPLIRDLKVVGQSNIQEKFNCPIRRLPG